MNCVFSDNWHIGCSGWWGLKSLTKPHPTAPEIILWGWIMFSLAADVYCCAVFTALKKYIYKLDTCFIEFMRLTPCNPPFKAAVQCFLCLILLFLIYFWFWRVVVLPLMNIFQFANIVFVFSSLFCYCNSQLNLTAHLPLLHPFHCYSNWRITDNWSLWIAFIEIVLISHDALLELPHNHSES